MNIHFFLAIFLSVSSTVFLYSQNKEQKGYILFPKCEKLQEEDLESCNVFELQKFVAHHLEYPKVALQKGYEGEVKMRYILTTDGNLLANFVKEKQNHPSLTKAAMQVMKELKDSISSGMIKVVPAILDGKSVISHYQIPITFAIPGKRVEQGNSEDPKKIVIATYRTSEKTVQFRRDLDGNIYAYSLYPESEKLLIKINGNAEPNKLSDEEQSYFFLYNLTFLKSEILLTLGKVDGREYELFIDKNADDSDDEQASESKMNINVYSQDNPYAPIETFRSVDQLLNSRYAPLLFK